MDIKRSKIMKRKNGGYSAYIWGEDMPRKYVYAPTAAECRIKLEELIDSVKDQIVDDKSTVAEFAQKWLEIRCANLSPTTTTEWKRLCNKHIIPAFGDIRVSRLTNNDIQRLVSDYNKTHSQKSTKCLTGVIHAMLEYAIKNRIISVNPCEDIYIAPTPKYKYYIYSKEEMDSLFKAIKDTRDEVPIYLAAGCALRMSEIMGLRWKDIDFDNHTLQVNIVAISHNKTATIKEVPKTKTSANAIPIPAYVYDILVKWRGKENDFIFPQPNGQPTLGCYYSKRFSRILKANNLPHTRFHDLRHYVATSLMDSGLPDKHVSKYLRHSDTNMTKKYEHIRQNVVRRPADTLDEIYGVKSGVNKN